MCEQLVQSCYMNVERQGVELWHPDCSRVREGSPVEVKWAVRWAGEDLWWEGFVEQVCFKSGM